LRQHEYFEVHNRSAILSTKIALPMNPELCVSKSGRIPEVRFF
jgi:hypothetical protein